MSREGGYDVVRAQWSRGNVSFVSFTLYFSCLVSQETCFQFYVLSVGI